MEGSKNCDKKEMFLGSNQCCRNDSRLSDIGEGNSLYAVIIGMLMYELVRLTRKLKKREFSNVQDTVCL